MKHARFEKDQGVKMNKKGSGSRTIPVRHSVDGLSAYLADKPEEPSSAIRLCFNENLYGPSPGAVKAITRYAGEVHLYPDPGGWHLREALAKKHELLPEQIILGNGADSLITLISTTFLDPREEVLFCTPTFPIYESAARIAMGTPVALPLTSRYQFDLNGLRDAITPKTKLIYLCNPNNPTGTVLPPSGIEAFLEEVPEGILVVLDEAYVDFMDAEKTPPIREWISRDLPIISLRTFSKAYGLAGMRVGYAMAAPEIIQALYRVREPFSVSSLAIHAAVGALSDYPHYQKVTGAIKRERERLQKALAERTLSYIPSQANFIFVEFGRDSQEICRAMQENGVLIRCSASWGMPTWARITIGPPEANNTLLQALDKTLNIS